jgi:hypothetical protein
MLCENYVKLLLQFDTTSDIIKMSKKQEVCFDEKHNYFESVKSR